MISPEARGRLASLMDDRRLELRLRWRDVAEAGGISYEALRDVRNGSGGIRRLTEHAIEAGLQWESGSVASILSGGDPVNVATPEPPRETPDPGDDVRGAVVAALYGPIERKIWARIRRRLAGTPAGRDLFAEPAQAAAWPPENAVGAAGGAPLDMTPEAREILDSMPASALFDDFAEKIVWNLDTLPYRRRIGMIRERWEPVSGAGQVRQAVLLPPDGLTA